MIGKYEWGVEYPTNGKRPELPKDARVSCKISGEWECDDDYSDEVDYWNWPKVQAFKVIDPRYKPVSEISENNPDCESVSESLDFKQSQPDISDLIIALSDASSLAVDLGLLDRAKEIMSVCKSVKDKDAREKVIEAAEAIALQAAEKKLGYKIEYKDGLTESLSALYDSGMLVLPPKKSNNKD